MRIYTVTCVERLPSGNWRVKTETGRPFVLVERMGAWKTPAVIWMRPPHPGRTVQIKMPDWRALRHRQLVGDALYEANIRRKKDLKRRRQTDADVQLWDRRFKTSRGSLSTAELALARFAVTEDERRAMTREAVEARGGRVALIGAGIGAPTLVAFERGGARGRIYDEAAGSSGDGQTPSPIDARQGAAGGADGRSETRQGTTTPREPSGRQRPTSGLSDPIGRTAS